MFQAIKNKLAVIALWILDKFQCENYPKQY